MWNFCTILHMDLVGSSCFEDPGIWHQPEAAASPHQEVEFTMRPMRQAIAANSLGSGVKFIGGLWVIPLCKAGRVDFDPKDDLLLPLTARQWL